MVSTLLERWSQAHQVFLAEHMSPLNPQFQQQLGLMQRAFQSHYTAPDALVRAHAALNNTMLLQADYWAYVQLFTVIGWLSFLCMFCVFIAKKVKATGPVAAH
jgi:hypothetical protein